MRSERKSPVRYGAALILLLLGTLAGVWHTRAVDRGQTDPLAGAAREVVAPPAHLLGRTATWLREQTDWLFRGRGVAEENRRLKARLDELEGEVATLREARINYERLRGDLGFAATVSPGLLAADVVAHRPDRKFDTLLLSRGRRDGVQVNSVVVTRRGLVGRVFEVTPHTASVLMLSDPNSGVSGRVQRADSRATGVCKGDFSPTLTMIYLAGDASIQPGDTIVSSGLGGVFPKGLVIGTVQEVKSEAGKLLKQARVRPAVDFERLEEVYILR
jgi:rod shape-determining protein MreC